MGLRPRLRVIEGDGVHLLHLPSPMYSVRNGNGPRGGAVPKGPLVRRRVPVGIPAPRFSRRETPFNQAGHYPAGGNGVKAILALFKGRHAEHLGDGAAHGRGIGQVDLFDNVPQ